MSVEVTTAGVVDLFRPIHGKIRDNLAEIGPQVLHWRPGPETNSVAALIQHIVWTERGSLLRIVGKVDPPGSRGLEHSDALGVNLLELLDGADAFLDEMARTIPTDSLAMQVVHPHRGRARRWC